MLALDLRRLLFLNIRFIFLVRVAIEPEPEESESELESELLDSEDEDEFIMSARTPGCDSSSIISCGVLSYM